MNLISLLHRASRIFSETYAETSLIDARACYLLARASTFN